MRVIAGLARGTKLISPKGYETRPTTDKTKEALFSIFFDKIDNCMFLDLFSGSGAIGIEALSRGAEKSYFVDVSREAVDLINKNLEKTKLNESAEVFNKDIISFINTTNKKFDIIYIDPPYKYDNTKSVLLEIIKSDIVNEDFLIVLEQDVDSKILEVSGLKVKSVRKYGKTNLVFYEASE